MMKKLLIVCWFFIFVAGCSKKQETVTPPVNTDPCNPQPAAPKISNNSPVDPVSDTLILSAEIISNANKYIWTLPDGLLFEGREYKRYNPNVCMFSGNYSVYYIVSAGCTSKVATTTVSFNLPQIPCAVQTNIIDFGFTTLDLSVFNFLTQVNGDNNYEIFADHSSGEVYVRFHQPFIPKSGVYDFTSNGAPYYPCEIYIEITKNGSGNYKSLNAKAYVINTNNKLSINFCNAEFNTGQAHLTGNITEP